MKNGVIAFCGSKGSGKSTSATIFKDAVRVQTEEIAIAGHLKECCAPIFGVDHNKFIEPKLKEVELDEYVILDSKNLTALLIAFGITKVDIDGMVRPHIGRILKTPRALLQYIGTEVLHPIDPLVHVKVAMRKKDPNKLTIITDLRFAQEFEYFKKNHGDSFLPVYVKNVYAEIAASVDSHPSERQFETFKSACRVLDNNGSMGELVTGINKLINEAYE